MLTCHLQDFNPKAERARMARGGGGGGGGGIATTRVKSKGPSGARATSAWPAARPAPATRPGSNKAAAAQKAAHRAAQTAAQRMHPHGHMGAPQRAGGGHMSAVVPTHRYGPGAQAAVAGDSLPGGAYLHELVSGAAWAVVGLCDRGGTFES
jgi:hypothetical protein